MFLFGKTMTNRLNGKKKNELNPLTCSLVNDVTKSSSKGSVKKKKRNDTFLNVKYKSSYLWQKAQFSCNNNINLTLYTEHKSVNLQYNTLGRLDDGTNKSSSKRLMFQVLFFFMISCKILCKNPFNLFSYFFIKLQN